MRSDENRIRRRPTGGYVIRKLTVKLWTSTASNSILVRGGGTSMDEKILLELCWKNVSLLAGNSRKNVGNVVVGGE